MMKMHKEVKFGPGRDFRDFGIPPTTPFDMNVSNLFDGANGLEEVVLNYEGGSAFRYTRVPEPQRQTVTVTVSVEADTRADAQMRIAEAVTKIGGKIV